MARRLSARPDAVIVGAGVIGAAVALELSKKGYRTLNVDRNAAVGNGSTSSSSACVRAHYSSREGVTMAYEGFSYWQRWADYLGAAEGPELAEYVNCGTVLLKSDNGQHERSLAHYDAIGVEYEDWDRAACHEHMPYLDLHRFWPPSRPDDDSFWADPAGEIDGAIFTPGSGYVSDPMLAARNLQEAAERAGGEFLFRRTVVDVMSNGRVSGVVLDDGERIDAPIVVNVAGPHSAAINRMAGVDTEMKITTKPVRHEVYVVPAPADLDLARDGFTISDGDLGIYFRPETGNSILVGSEDPACDPLEWAQDPDDFERRVSRASWETQVYRLARRLPSLQVPSQMRGLADLYDVSDDWMPVYDRSSLAGFYLAIGTSGNQFKNAPIAGYVMAELIDASENGRDHDRDPVQLRMPHTGLPLNLGFFSRNRDVDPNSSYSVNG
jgi:sarcosine oxidase, subunit beta